MTTRNFITGLLKQTAWLLPGSVVKRFLKCRRKGCEICRRQDGHGPVYYLSILGEDGHTHMLYVHKGYLEEVKEATRAYQQLKAAVRQLGKEQLRRWCKERRLKQP